MNMQFVPQRDFCPADHNILRRRLQSLLGLEAPHAAGDELSGECVDLRSGVRLVVRRRFRRVKTSSGFSKACAYVQILAQISEGGRLHQSQFLRKERVGLLGLEQLMNAAVRTGLLEVSGYAGRVRSDDWGSQGTITTKTCRSGTDASTAICSASA